MTDSGGECGRKGRKEGEGTQHDDVRDLWALVYYIQLEWIWLPRLKDSWTHFLEWGRLISSECRQACLGLGVSVESGRVLWQYVHAMLADIHRAATGNVDRARGQAAILQGSMLLHVFNKKRESMNVIQGQMKYIVYNRVWPKKFLLFFQRTFFRGYLFWGCLRLTQVCVCVHVCVLYRFPQHLFGRSLHP